MIIPNMWENKTCSKPPTSYGSYDFHGLWYPPPLSAPAQWRSAWHESSVGCWTKARLDWVAAAGGDFSVTFQRKRKTQWIRLFPTGSAIAILGNTNLRDFMGVWYTVGPSYKLVPIVTIVISAIDHSNYSTWSHKFLSNLAIYRGPMGGPMGPALTGKLSSPSRVATWLIII